MFDVAIIGGGPGGATCAALCAAGGMRVLLLERSRFPREKVCGDCLNPLAWQTLRELGVGETILATPHVKLEAVRFVSAGGAAVRVPLPLAGPPELGITRSRLDAILLDNARLKGTEVFEETTLTALSRAESHWRLDSTQGSFTARQIVAADGRNSSVLRLLRMFPPPHTDERVGLQTHFAVSADLAAEVVMHFLPEGYAGLAPVGEGMANLCMVGRACAIKSLKIRVMRQFELTEKQLWRSIAPLSRAPMGVVHEGLWLVGDAARVVEPFTGEGIAYAIRSGALCAEALLEQNPRRYRLAHRRLYEGRLWVNRLAKATCLYPGLGSAVVRMGRIAPWILGKLTQKVVV